MGALRRIALLVFVPVALGGAVACEPGGGVSGISVAYTTDQAATAEIERRDVDVRWLTCTAARDDHLVSVDCQGETAGGKDITVTGKVERAVDGKCVRGDLRADVGKKELFRVSGLGDCGSATPSPVEAPSSSAGPSGSAPPGGPSGVRPTVTVTVTVTRTVDAQGGQK
ncbi:hypothetical protein [Streptomyces griseoruber]|uniref:Lipoprotein n=1 Tax=Streptomyces griseoruber TaxID=1943 RepID=A0A101SP80_9ACTN|nr:hypothetical protein [Streptomyces griseoruber]KUN77463.1 hypothetical protein AQJ64_33570 [Streptomyces griseoruber]